MNTIENNNNFETNDSNYMDEKGYFDYLLSLKNGEDNEAVDYNPSFMYL